MLLGLEQPHVLNCNRCLIGESLNQRNLFVCKRLDPSLGERNDAHWSTFAEHWDSEHRPKIKQILGLGECILWVCSDIDDLDRAAFEQGATHRSFPIGADRRAFPQFEKFAREIMSSHRAAGISVVTENHSSLRAAQ